MADQPRPRHGQICWHEVMTPDPEAAKTFYTKLFGWDVRRQDMGPMTYHFLSQGGQDFGGIMGMKGPEWQGVPPNWMVYVAVDDIEATVRQVEELGGKVCVRPTTIPVGRFAVIQDPQGAAFSLFQFA